MRLKKLLPSTALRNTLLVTNSLAATTLLFREQNAADAQSALLNFLEWTAFIHGTCSGVTETVT